ncbi:ABC transporter permease [Clostridium sp. 19966]|uniref:ABC transporter permease n=1 Tax=Clostridium sp. 19966 TaxID=2768166 RepID=UPI0028DFAADD|nr:ABC transporter permease [Clostridium sp. 19966]MDT8716900.1 ABC transporter permease [Clostridium sp. 19966]
MNYFAMTKDSLRKNSKKYITFVIICIISITLEFLYTTLIYNSEIELVERNSVLSIILKSSISIIILTLSSFTIFSYTSYIKLRINDFKIMLLLGVTKKEIALWVFYENLFLTLFCLLAGLILGTIFSKIFFLMVISYLGFYSISFSLGMMNYVSTLELFILLYIIITIRTNKMLRNLAGGSDENIMKQKLEKFREIIKLIVLVIFIFFAVWARVNKNENGYIFVWICCMIGLYVTVFYLSKLWSYIMKKRNSYYSRNFLSVKQLVKNIENDKNFIFWVAYISFLFVTYSWICELSVFNEYSKAITMGGIKMLRFIALIGNVIFFGISAAAIYFKAQIEMENTGAYIKKLYLVGLTKKELDLLIKYRLVSMFFTPCTLCIIMSLIFMLFIGIHSQLVFFTRLVIVICYSFHVYGYKKARKLYEVNLLENRA